LIESLEIDQIVEDFPGQIVADMAKKANILAQLGASKVLQKL
jgi:hypothetical protein